MASAKLAKEKKSDTPKNESLAITFEKATKQNGGLDQYEKYVVEQLELIDNVDNATGIHYDLKKFNKKANKRKKKSVKVGESTDKLSGIYIIKIESEPCGYFYCKAVKNKLSSIDAIYNKNYVIIPNKIAKLSKLYVDKKHYSAKLFEAIKNAVINSLCKQYRVTMYTDSCIPTDGVDDCISVCAKRISLYAIDLPDVALGIETPAKKVKPLYSAKDAKDKKKDGSSTKNDKSCSVKEKDES